MYVLQALSCPSVQKPPERGMHASLGIGMGRRRISLGQEFALSGCDRTQHVRLSQERPKKALAHMPPTARLPRTAGRTNSTLRSTTLSTAGGEPQKCVSLFEVRPECKTRIVPVLCQVCWRHAEWNGLIQKPAKVYPAACRRLLTKEIRPELERLIFVHETRPAGRPRQSVADCSASKACRLTSAFPRFDQVAHSDRRRIGQATSQPWRAIE